MTNDEIVEHILAGRSWDDLLNLEYDVTMQNLTVILIRQMILLRRALDDPR